MALLYLLYLLLLLSSKSPTFPFTCCFHAFLSLTRKMKTIPKDSSIDFL